MSFYVIFIFFQYYLRILSYIFFIFIFLFFWYFILNFNKSILWYHVIFSFYYMHLLQISYIIGIDGISLLFVILCTFLLMYCLLSYWFVRYKVNLYIFTLIFSLWLLLNIFTSMDLFFFYIFFEGIVIPMFLLIVSEEVGLEKYTLLINFLFIPYLALFLF